MYTVRWILLLGVTAGIALAQNDSRQATMRGSRGDRGKCTIEVNVDGVAEIEINGTRANMRTLQGVPARFVRFECNDTPPRYPDDFRFSGIDGRGRQTLIRDPRENRGVAVVRIEDPKGGSEGYTFDIEWTGYANSSTNGRGGGFWNNGGGVGNNGRGGGFGNNNGNAARAIDLWTLAVRDKANRDYGYRNIDMGRVAMDNNPGRNDWVMGRFSYRRGQTRDEFEFNCSVDFTSGRVRSVDIKRW